MINDNVVSKSGSQGASGPSPEGTAERCPGLRPISTCLDVFRQYSHRIVIWAGALTGLSRVTQRLWRGVRRACPERSRENPPRRCLFYPCCLELFDHEPAPHGGLLSFRATNIHTAIARESTIHPEFTDIAQTSGRKMITVHERMYPSHPVLTLQQILLSEASVVESLSSIGKMTPPRFLRLRSGQALRLRATSAVLRDQSVRRSAQG